MKKPAPESDETTSEAPPPRWLDRLFTPFPNLCRDDRIELSERITLGAQGGVDFHVMMVLAAALASLGLLQGSTAVVIGAMLVAPLMGPLVGAGLALVQANPSLFRTSLTVAGLGILWGLGVSVAVGLTNPGFEPSLELQARGQPDLFDLAIAFASGMAAAWASGRPNVATTLAGVAIAAALVPPLAVVGIALTNGRPFLAAGASILLATNLVAIVLGAAVVFRALGVQQARGSEGVPPWARRAVMLLLLLTLLLGTPLLLNLLERQKTGLSSPIAFPVAVEVRRAADLYLQSWPGTSIIMMSRTSVEPGADINVLILSQEPLPDGFEKGLSEVVREARGDDKINVLVYPLLAARRAQPSPPSLTR